MGVKLFIGVLALLTGALYRPCLASDVTLELRDWPAPVSREAASHSNLGSWRYVCLRLRSARFSFLAKNRLPSTCFPRGADNARNSALFLSATRDAYIGK